MPSSLGVSVVIPLHNRANLVRYTLDSLDPRLHPGVDLEVVVVDDGSTDGSDEVVEKYYPWIRLMRQKQAGAPAARNAGSAVARHDFIVYLDSDDVVEPAFFRQRIAVLAGNPEASFVLASYAHFEGEGHPSEGVSIPFRSGDRQDGLIPIRDLLSRYLGGKYVPPHSIVWRKEVLERIGGHDTNLHVNQDVDLVVRALLRGFQPYGSSGPRAWKRVHRSSGQGNIGSSKEKVGDILLLRRRWEHLLRSGDLADKEMRTALGCSCAKAWVACRGADPVAARVLLELSKGLTDRPLADARWVWRAIARIVGGEKALLLRGFLGPKVVRPGLMRFSRVWNPPNVA